MSQELTEKVKEAEEKAREAKEKLEIAETKAREAREKLEIAEKKAREAKEETEKAETEDQKEKAAAKMKEAETAQEAAERAKIDAQTAQEAAEKAETDAKEAQRIAAEAQTALEEAQKAANTQETPTPPKKTTVGTNGKVVESFTDEKIKKIQEIFGKDYKFSGDKNSLIFDSPKSGENEARRFLVKSDRMEMVSKAPLDEESCRKMLEAAKELYGDKLILFSANKEEVALMRKVADKMKLDTTIAETKEEFDKKVAEAREKNATNPSITVSPEKSKPKPSENPTVKPPAIDPAKEKQDRINGIADDLGDDAKQQAMLKAILAGEEYSDIFDIKDTKTGGKEITLKVKDASSTTDVPHVLFELNEAVKKISGDDPTAGLDKNTLKLSKAQVDNLKNKLGDAPEPPAPDNKKVI